MTIIKEIHFWQSFSPVSVDLDFIQNFYVFVKKKINLLKKDLSLGTLKSAFRIRG